MFSLAPLGDEAVVVQLSHSISPETYQRVKSFSYLLQQNKLPGIREWTPAYNSVTVFYDPYRLPYQKLTEFLHSLEEELHQVDAPPSRVIHIPVCYGGPFGPDLPFVAQYRNLTPQEVVAKHVQPTYLIYMLGFAPGFPYLGGLPPALATPRRPSPRRRVEAGSVGIAGHQTGIYSITSPGGWQIIGRTPLKLYDPAQPHFLLQPGDYVRFFAIDGREFEKIKGEVEQGAYEPLISEHRGELS